MATFGETPRRERDNLSRKERLAKQSEDGSAGIVAQALYGVAVGSGFNAGTLAVLQSIAQPAFASAMMNTVGVPTPGLTPESPEQAPTSFQDFAREIDQQDTASRSQMSDSEIQKLDSTPLSVSAASANVPEPSGPEPTGPISNWSYEAMMGTAPAPQPAPTSAPVSEPATGRNAPIPKFDTNLGSEPIPMAAQQEPEEPPPPRMTKQERDEQKRDNKIEFARDSFNSKAEFLARKSLEREGVKPPSADAPEEEMASYNSALAARGLDIIAPEIGGGYTPTANESAVIGKSAAELEKSIAAANTEYEEAQKPKGRKPKKTKEEEAESRKRRLESQQAFERRNAERMIMQRFGVQPNWLGVSPMAGGQAVIPGGVGGAGFGPGARAVTTTNDAITDFMSRSTETHEATASIATEMAERVRIARDKILEASR